MEEEGECQTATAVLPSSTPPQDGKQVDEAAQVNREELDPKPDPTCIRDLCRMASRRSKAEMFNQLTHLFSSITASLRTETCRVIADTTLNPSIADPDLTVLRFMIQTGEDLNHTDDLGRTPIWKAVSRDGHSEKVRLLVDAGCDVNLADVHGTTPLLVATTYANSNLVEYVSILLGAGASPDPVDSNVWTPLMQLIYRASDDPFKMPLFVKAVQLLIDAGCDVNRAFKPDTKFSRTPLMMTVLKKLPRIAEVLLNAGADPDMPNYDGAFEDGCRIVSRPLHKIALGGSLEIGRLLIQANCDRTLTDGMNNNCPAHNGSTFSRTPLNLAIHMSRFAFVQMLLDADFDGSREAPIVPFEDVTVESKKIEGLLQELKRRPCTLQSLARSAVRCCLRGGKSRQRIAALELPRSVKDDLLFKNIL